MSKKIQEEDTSVAIIALKHFLLIHHFSPPAKTESLHSRLPDIKINWHFHFINFHKGCVRDSLIQFLSKSNKEYKEQLISWFMVWRRIKYIFVGFIILGNSVDRQLTCIVFIFKIKSNFIFHAKVSNSQNTKRLLSADSTRQLKYQPAAPGCVATVSW